MGMLVDRRDELGRARSQTINRLHRVLLELFPGGPAVLVLPPVPRTAARPGEAFRRVVALRPGDAVARAELGRCLLEMGERDAGEASIRLATRESPELFGRAIMSLAISSRGRFFLRPSAAAKFLRG